MSTNPRPDPVRARRAQVARVVRRAKAIGYTFLTVSIVTFAAGAASGFPSVLLDVTIGAFLGAIVVLPLPIVLGYGVRAAERDDRRAGRT